MRGFGSGAAAWVRLRRVALVKLKRENRTLSWAVEASAEAFRLKARTMNLPSTASSNLLFVDRLVVWARTQSDFPPVTTSSSVAFDGLPAHGEEREPA